jgi:teichuronic acid biosynthesis glycosyltransferase TuaC
LSNRRYSNKKEDVLRVLAVIPGEGEGASMIFARRQVASLARLGIEVQTFYLASRVPSLQLFKEISRFRRIVREYQPQVVHAQYGTATSFFCSLITSLPLVITFRGGDLNGHAERSLVMRQLGQLLSQMSALRAAKIICVSDQLRNRLWWRRSRAVVLPTGVDLNIFRVRSKDEARAILGWEIEGRTVICYTGKNPVAKGLDFVTAAVHSAEARIGPIRLVALDGTVPPDDMPMYLNAADCLAVASKKEGSPTIVQEALACNLPVVAVPVGDVPERLAGVYPSKVVPRDVSEFANALAEIIQTKCRSNGREMVAGCSDIKIAQATSSIYCDVARSHGTYDAILREELHCPPS